MDAKRIREAAEMAQASNIPVVLSPETVAELKKMVETGEAAKALLPFVVEVEGMKPLSRHVAHEIASGLNL